MRQFRAVLDRVSWYLSLVAGLALVSILLLTMADVVRRTYLDQRSIVFAIPLTEVLLSCVAFLTLPWAQRQKEHVSVDLLVDRLHDRVRPVVTIVQKLMAAIFLAWMALITSGFGLAAMARGEVRTGIVEIPLWPARIVLPVAFALMVLQILFQAYDDVVELRGGTPLDVDEISGVPEQPDSSL